jgi:hypothetical protein
VCACATLADMCALPMTAERTTALLTALGQCAHDCPQHTAVLDAAIESFCATHAFTGSVETAEAEGEGTSQTARAHQPLSTSQQGALKEIIHLPEQQPGLLMFGRMLMFLLFCRSLRCCRLHACLQKCERM